MTTKMKKPKSNWKRFKKFKLYSGVQNQEWIQKNFKWKKKIWIEISNLEIKLQWKKKIEFQMKIEISNLNLNLKVKKIYNEGGKINTNKILKFQKNYKGNGKF